MKSLCQLNSISPSLKYKLLAKRVLSNLNSLDANFMSLRRYYMESAIVLRDMATFRQLKIVLSGDKFTVADKWILLEMLEKQEFLLSIHMLYEISGFSVRDIEEVIHSKNIKPVHHPAMSEEGSLFSVGEYYNSKKLFGVVKQLYTMKDFGQITQISQHSVKDTKRLFKGMNILHPEGAIGVARSFKLYSDQCQKILIPPVAAPQEPALTYETIDYDKLDLRRIYKKKNFKQFLTLCNCADKDYLIDFLMGDGTDASLAVLAKKVSKLPTMQQAVIQALSPAQPQQPKKPLTIAEKKQKFKTIASKYFTPRPQPSDYAGKTLNQIFNMETATARAKHKALTSEDGVDEDYYALLINDCRTSEHLPTIQKKIEFVTMHGLIPSDIREDDSDQFTEDYLNSEVERVLPKIQTSFNLWHYYSKNIDKDTLKNESRRAENVQLFLTACEDIKDSEYDNSYVTMSDIFEMLNIYPTDQIMYNDKQISLKSLLALTYNIPEDKILKWSTTGYENVCKYVKSIADFIIASLAADKQKRAEKKLAAAQGSLDLLNLSFYQGLLQSYLDSPDDRPWVDNTGAYNAKTRAEFEITRLLDEISEVSDPTEAGRLNDLCHLIETFKAELSSSDNKPATDEEYLDQLQQHIVAVG